MLVVRAPEPMMPGFIGTIIIMSTSVKRLRVQSQTLCTHGYHINFLCAVNLNNKHLE